MSRRARPRTPSRRSSQASSRSSSFLFGDERRRPSRVGGPPPGERKACLARARQDRAVVRDLRRGRHRASYPDHAFEREQTAPNEDVERYENHQQRPDNHFVVFLPDRSIGHSRGLSIGEAPLPSPKRGRSRNLTRSGERWLLLALLRELLPESRTAPRPRVQHFDALPAPGAGAPPEDDRRREADEARAGQDHRLQIPPELDLVGDDRQGDEDERLYLDEQDQEDQGERSRT